MKFWSKKKKEAEPLPKIQLSIDDVRQLITDASRDLPLHISLRALVKDDYSIDFTLLQSKLKGIPMNDFFMSKETFEVFETPEMARIIDEVQRAIDQYVKENGKLPVIPGSNQISYFLIRDYLRDEPTVSLYVTKGDNLVTHRRPTQ
ncbi:DUF3939 domain-containing protein [Alkalihalobacterium bogoriense]|uniref:DUF3939 domain-containing protein n=1 Tax=Alkalihalobacterium bogoriense TaxID=246272 RepID=UPI00047E8FD8|nr:DUF3939 domain-containing protein [Alkalihalobacterium bogoriense]